MAITQKEKLESWAGNFIYMYEEHFDFLNIDYQKKVALIKYASLVMDYNKNINITGAENIENFIKEHIIDSLLALNIFKNCDNIIDIGSGAGLPSIPLAIVYENKKFALCESKNKKADFLDMAKKELSLNNIEIKRVNVYEIKEKYETITARAFSDIKTLLKIFKRLKHKNSVLIAYKGKLDKIKEELEEIKNIEKYNFKIKNLNNKEKERNIVIIK